MITAHDEFTIINALRMAAEAYTNEAERVKAVPWMHRQFVKQSDAALALADRIEAEGIDQ